MDRTDTSLGPSGPPDFLECGCFTFPEARKEVMARILVIEDNAMTMKHVVMLLRNAGHTALSAADAEAGLILARTGKPDLILMDIQLPGMDGLAATALLKADPITAAIPIIVLTATLTKNDEDKARAAGSDGYIVKPFLRQELDLTIAELLRNSIDALLQKGGPPAASTEP
jgi:two-component system, cell cycle response regulator DivK